MKKFKSFLLASMLTLSVVGCGTSSEEPPKKEPEKVEEEAAKEEDKEEEKEEAKEEEKEKEEVVEEVEEGLSATISVQVETGWLEYYEEAVERVKEEHPNATINLLEMGSFDNLDIIDQTDVTNPDVADVFAIPLDRVYGLAQNEVLSELDVHTMAEELGGFGDYDAGLGGGFNIDEQYLAFPYNIETLIVFANSANAESMGVDLSAGIEFNDIGMEDMLSVVHDAWFGVAFTNSVDMTLLDYDESGELYSDLTKNFGELTADHQAFFTSLFEYWKKHDTAGTDLWDKDAAWGYLDAAFTSGNTASLRIDGPWATPGMLEKTSDGADLAVLPIDVVTVNGNPLAHWQSGWGIGVNARIEGMDEEMALAQEMIMEIVNPEYAVDIFKATGKILQNVTAEVYQESDLSEADKRVIASTLESYQDAAVRPLFTEWGQVWTTWQNGLLSWASVKPATVEEAYEQVQASFIAMMATFDIN